MEKIVRQSMLYDFYGELLTEHQKSIYEDVVVNDLSYSEIARLNGISRQGVCEKILEEYEDKLRLVERFEQARDKASVIKQTIQEMKHRDSTTDMDALLDDIDNKMGELLEQF